MTLWDEVQRVVKAFDPDQPRDEDGRWTEDLSRPKHSKAEPHQKKVRYGDFQIKDGKLLIARLGPMNPLKQEHFASSWKPASDRGLVGNNRPPVSRGYWASPFGHDDPYLYAHRYEALLPKKFQRGSPEAKRIEQLLEESLADRTGLASPHLPNYLDGVNFKTPEGMAKYQEVQAYWDAHAAALKAISKREKVHTAWVGKFWSHIPPAWEPKAKLKAGGGQRWYEWDNVQEWAKQARKFMWAIERWDGKKPGFIPYDRMQLEIFVPGVAE